MQDENEEFKDQLKQMLTVSTSTMAVMRQDGFVAEMAKLYASLVEELQKNGFSRQEALQIATYANLGGNSSK